MVPSVPLIGSPRERLFQHDSTRVDDEMCPKLSHPGCVLLPPRRKRRLLGLVRLWVRRSCASSGPTRWAWGGQRATAARAWLWPHAWRTSCLLRPPALPVPRRTHCGCAWGPQLRSGAHVAQLDGTLRCQGQRPSMTRTASASLRLRRRRREARARRQRPSGASASHGAPWPCCVQCACHALLPGPSVAPGRTLRAPRGSEFDAVSWGFFGPLLHREH